MKVGVVLFSCHNARAEVLSVIELPRLHVLSKEEQDTMINNEFERIKKNFLATISDHSGLDVYCRIYDNTIWGQNVTYPSDSTLAKTLTQIELEKEYDRSNL